MGEDELELELGLGFRKIEDRRTKKRLFLLNLTPPSAADSSLKLFQSSKNNQLLMKEDEDDEFNHNFSTEFGRKKLRLTRDQTTLLEDSFRKQTTLNTAEKQALAEKLKLKPRQVEVWFQNRRARNKLKQTEVDYEFLKKNYEILFEENRRLKEELSKLRSSSPPPETQVPEFLNDHKAAPD